MRRISLGLVLALVLVVGLFSFQNCAQNGGFSTDSTLVDSPSDNTAKNSIDNKACTHLTGPISGPRSC